MMPACTENKEIIDDELAVDSSNAVNSAQSDDVGNGMEFADQTALERGSTVSP